MYKATIVRDVTGEEALDTSPSWFVLPEGVEPEDVLFHKDDVVMANAFCYTSQFEVFLPDLSGRYYLPADAVEVAGEGHVTVTFLRDVLEKEVSKKPASPERVVFQAGKTHEVDGYDASVFEEDKSDYWWPPQGSFTVAYGLAEEAQA